MCGELDWPDPWTAEQIISPLLPEVDLSKKEQSEDDELLLWPCYSCFCFSLNLISPSPEVMMVRTSGPAPGLSRRTFLRGVAGGALTLVSCATTLPTANGGKSLDPRVPTLLASTLTIDMHTHAAGASGAQRPRYDLVVHMRQGHLTAVCLCHSADGPVIRRVEGGRLRQIRTPAPGELYTHTQRRLAFMDRLVADQGLRRALSPEDLWAAQHAGEPALIGTIEGCHFVEGQLERIQEVYDRGIRQLQLVHYMPSDLGDIQTEAPAVGGLGAPGAEVIRACNRLGIVVDVAHGSFEMVQQAATVSRTPLVLSHTSLARTTPSRYSRLISADHAKLIAQTQGVIGIWPARFQFADVPAWVEGMARMADVAGIDHVGVGTDMEGGINEVCVDYADLPVLADCLLRHGFTPVDAAKVLGGNYRRVWNTVVQARSA